MKEFLRKNFAIIAAFTLPIAFIFIITIIAYIPSLFVSTDYNFIYATCADGKDYYPNRCQEYLRKRFSVADNKIVVNDVDLRTNNEVDARLDLDRDGILDIPQDYQVRLFFHDTEKNESREITLEEARTFSLHGLLTSPDGITVSSDNNSGAEFFLFSGGGSSYGYYMTKGNSKIKLNLINNDDRYYYQDNFHFLGWVVPGRN